MPTPTDRPTGAPCWIEITTSDVEKTTAFYAGLFGWHAEQGSMEEYGGYLSFDLGGKAVAGGMAAQDQGGPADIWSVYLQTDDAARTAEAATAHGGQVYVPPMEVPQVGTMAFVADPSGAAVGAWQAGPFTGFEVVGEPGAPAWFELHTRDYDRDVTFYADVFGWEPQVVADEPDFRYTTLGVREGQVAGIMDASQWAPEAPMEWAIYFFTDDCDASCARAVELGGSMVTSPEDTPYGRMASLTDSTGASFKLLTPPTG